MTTAILLAAAFAGAFPAAARAAAAPFAPIQVIPNGDAEFPPEAFTLGFAGGEARVVVAVDARGQLTDSLIVHSTHPSFGLTALRTIRHWQYGPARWRGVAVSATREIEFHFRHSAGAVVIQSLPDHLEARLRDDEPNTYLYRTYNLSELDRSPAPVALAAPVYPAQLRTAGVRGTVGVRFYVDEQGQARIPEVTQAAAPALAELSLAAVRHWHFAPARRRGRPVLVRVSLEIRFGGSPGPPAGGE